MALLVGERACTAKLAKDADLEIIAWTLERSGPLAQDVGVMGAFSDWPATVIYYANCMDSDV